MITTIVLACGERLNINLEPAVVIDSFLKQLLGAPLEGALWRPDPGALILASQVVAIAAKEQPK